MAEGTTTTTAASSTGTTENKQSNKSDDQNLTVSTGTYMYIYCCIIHHVVYSIDYSLQLSHPKTQEAIYS